MADTTTPLLGLLLMGVGGDNNAWGGNLNNNVITPIENAIAGTTTITATGGAYVLSAAEALSAIIIINSALVSNLTITVPTLSKKWTFINLTSGAFSVLVKTAAQVTPTQAPQQKSTDMLVMTSNNSVIRLDRVSVGEFFIHAAASPNGGALACNGAILLIANYPDLASTIGTTWGGNGTTTFGLPNGQDTGRFLRSSTGGVPVGTYQGNQNKTHTHTGSGTTSGVSQFHTHTGSGTTSAMSANASHSHSGVLRDANNSANVTSGAPIAGSHYGVGGSTDATNTDHTHTYSFTTSADSVDHTHTYSFTTSTGSADGTEARPESLTGLMCIRY